MDPAPNDASLIQRAARGDVSAFHVLVDRHAEALLAVAYSLAGNTADAEDLVQQTLMAALESTGRFRGQSAVKTWLIGILVKQVAAWRRHQKIRRSASLTEDAVELADRRVDADTRIDVAAAMEHLSPEHREVLVLREYGGLSYEEIAATLGLPRGTVESRIHRARLELRDHLRGYGTAGC